MNLSKSLLVMIFGAVFAFLPASAQEAKKADTPKSESKTEATKEPKKADSNAPQHDYDVVYTKAGDVELKLDIARPAGTGDSLPTVLVIHGGGWQGGNKESNRRFLDQLAAKGFVAISPQYRLVPKAIFPAQVHDVKAAVRWAKANAAKYRIDPDRMGAMGFSAGGHLALMLGLTGEKDGLEGNLPPTGQNTKIKAVVNYFGPTDLDGEDIPDLSKPIVEKFLGGPLKDRKKEASQASPLDFVTEGDPPVLTFQGTKDPLVPHTQAYKLADAMTVKNVRGRVALYVGDGHGWEGIEKTLVEATDFLLENLKKSDQQEGRRRRF
ncbi:MAG: alpha/beta hydrolase fold domain-containing protein [bacterium]